MSLILKTKPYRIYMQFIYSRYLKSIINSLLQMGPYHHNALCFLFRTDLVFVCEVGELIGGFTFSFILWQLFCPFLKALPAPPFTAFALDLQTVTLFFPQILGFSGELFPLSVEHLQCISVREYFRVWHLVY